MHSPWRTACSELGCSFFSCCQRAQLPKLRLEKMGHFFKKMSRCYLGIFFPNSRFLGLGEFQSKNTNFYVDSGRRGGLQLEITAFSLEPSVPPPRCSHSALMVCSYVHISVSSRRAWRSGTLSFPGLLFFCPEGEQHTCGLKLFFSS